MSDEEVRELVDTISKEEFPYALAIAKAYEKLEQENEKLKAELELYKGTLKREHEVIHKVNELEEENEELKKQLEEANKMCELYVKSLYNAELCECKNQQKEFIKFLEEPIKTITDGNPTNISEYTIGKLDALKEILSKYKEIIGDVEDD